MRYSSGKRLTFREMRIVACARMRTTWRRLAAPGSAAVPAGHLGGHREPGARCGTPGSLPSPQAALPVVREGPAVTFTAPASKVLTVLHIQDPDGCCVMDCDDDCEVGPRHCVWVHLPNHKRGWHSEADCPFRGEESPAGQTRCGLPMVAAELWVPVEQRDTDSICRACLGVPDEQEGMW